MATKSAAQGAFEWSPQPAAAALVDELLAEMCTACNAAEKLGRHLHERTGTRLVDWSDHLALPGESEFTARLAEVGFVDEGEAEVAAAWGTGARLWRHPRGIFPAILTHDAPADGGTARLAVGVESVADFLVAWQIDDSTPIVGAPGAALRAARVPAEGRAELWVVERHGETGFAPRDIPPAETAALLVHAEAFRRRRRAFDDDGAGFAHARELIRAAAGELGVDRACDLFFAAEREYWESRNRAAQLQRARQQALGLGWANHDHHTYRSSRRWFGDLVAALEELGFVCRERFYAGREAGWGAQVLEQAASGVVIFADVDLSPDEVQGDFAHEPLAARDELGTVGLWCRLHGEAFLQAGMHHLECQFDFDAARRQLDKQGIETMAPFTDFPHLKQAFTVGEIWPVEPDRIDTLLSDGLIDRAEADRFRRDGALGSHLEILERNDGYKGFNQTGVSEIIRETDPRKE